MIKIRNKKNTLFILTSLLGLIFFLTQINVHVLEIKRDDGKTDYIKLNEDDGFSIIWQHSVEKEEWEEFFQIKNGAIYLTSTRFKTFGAGVPSKFKSSYMKDGWLYVPNLNVFIGELTIRAGNQTNHRLIHNNYHYPLSNQKTNSISYTLNKTKIPLLYFMIELCKSSMLVEAVGMKYLNDYKYV